MPSHRAFENECHERELEYTKHHWPRPIPVSERLPEEGQCVLFFNQDMAGMDEEGSEWDVWQWGSCSGGVFYEMSDHTYPCTNVSHWLPMPPKPDACATAQTTQEPRE